MREIKASAISKAVAELCHKSNYQMGDDIIKALEEAQRWEKSPMGREALGDILENARLASKVKKPLCQDCGTVVVFLDIGQEVHITGGDLSEAVAEGVRRCYVDEYMRKSMVNSPFSVRSNTGDNTPPVIHTEIVPGDKLKIALTIKGSGAENKSRMAMLRPGAGQQGIIDMVAETIVSAGGGTCPPVVIGLGVGGNIEKAMIMAKKALLRPVGEPSPDAETAELEAAVLERVNDTGIGPMGYGGTVTALAVHAQAMPSHIASLPVAVNLQCHSIRHGEVVL